MLPDVVPFNDLNKMIAEGATELNRGISTSNNVPAQLYARELLLGTLYPGTLSAMGNGIHLATPSKECKRHGFPTISVVAEEYAKKCPPGVVVRCVLKKCARCLDADELKQLYREERNRAHEVGIKDVGALAAAFGFDAFFCDGVYEHTPERVWVVVNRGMLVFQNIGLQIAD